MNRARRNKNQDRVAIIAGVRTPFARQWTDFRDMTAIELGTLAVNELLLRTGIDKTLVDRVVYGQVIQTPEAPNIAREIVLQAGLNIHTDAYSVTRACATSLQALVSAAESIQAGQIDTAIVGGADSTSVLPIGVSKKMASALIGSSKAKTWRKKLQAFRGIRGRDLLPVPPPIAEYSTGLSMGDTAEQMAKTHHISREAQDDFAYRSHQRAAEAWSSGLMAQEVMHAYPRPYRTALHQDNNIRPKAERADYDKLRPAFDRVFGSVTAANSTPLTDGASALLVMRESLAQSLSLPILGYLKSYAFQASHVQQDMLMGPAYTIPVALDRAGLSLSDIDLIEMHEAFAAQVLANLKALDSQDFAATLGRKQPVGEVDMDRLNIWGGSVAYGHPFAATGGRLVSQLLNELNRRGGGLGLIAACAAGGLGAAMVLEVES